MVSHNTELIIEQLQAFGGNTAAVAEALGLSVRYVQMVAKAMKAEAAELTVVPSPESILEKLIPPATPEIIKLRKITLDKLTNIVETEKLTTTQLLEVLDRLVRYEEELRKMGNSAAGTLTHRDANLAQTNNFNILIERLREEVPGDKLHQLTNVPKAIFIEGNKDND